MNVGKRHGKPVVLVIRAQEFVSDGNELYRSANGVWQAKEVPAKYFAVQYLKNLDDVNAVITNAEARADSSSFAQVDRLKGTPDKDFIG